MISIDDIHMIWVNQFTRFQTHIHMVSRYINSHVFRRTYTWFKVYQFTRSSSTYTRLNALIHTLYKDTNTRFRSMTYIWFQVHQFTRFELLHYTQASSRRSVDSPTGNVYCRFDCTRTAIRTTKNCGHMGIRDCRRRH